MEMLGIKLFTGAGDRMRIQKWRQKDYRNSSTKLKYFFSYFILLSLLLFGFFLAVRFQLSNIYTKNLNGQAKKRLEDAQEDLSRDLISVDQVNSLLIKDMDIIMTRYINDDWYHYQAAKKLDSYSTGNNIIDSICYIDLKNHTILSSGRHIRLINDVYEIYDGKNYIKFPLDEYSNTMKNQLISLQTKESRLLVYLPYNNRFQSFQVFYILDLREIKNLMDSVISPGITSVGILNEKKDIIAGSNTTMLNSCVKKTKDVHKSANAEDETLYIESNLPSNYSIAAVLSNKDIVDMVGKAFQNTYIILLVLFGVGLIVILFSMRLTYWPLHRLTEKLIPSYRANQGYVEQLDLAFTSMSSENQELQEKVDSYRLSMQKSILDSIVNRNSEISLENNVDIDALFSLDKDSTIFIVKIATPEKKTMSARDIKQLIDDSLPGNTPGTLLENAEEYMVFLIHYAGTENDKGEVLHLLMSDLYDATGYKISISNSTLSPLEIPHLYENAMIASKYWTRHPVISYDDISNRRSERSNLAYPYEQLDQLGHSLASLQFEQAKVIVDELLSLLDKSMDSSSLMPDFFIRCVLIDILSGIVNSMNRLNIKFSSYSELYFNALYLCRSTAYAEERGGISESIHTLIDTYEAEYENAAIQVDQIEKILQENYTSPDFSISSLADHFNVSIAYMSYLFKKNYKVNFIDYLWELRMNKAKEMLSMTNTNINEISIAVGYLNTSSFRRRFKQETGQTPSQYRKTKEKSK